VEKNIFLIGAGQSATILINYLLKTCEESDWHLTVGDANLELAQKKLEGHPSGRAIAFDVNDQEALADEVAKADIVVSMLPARFHIQVAEVCLKEGVHLVTASYISKEMMEMDKEAKEKNILFLNECGLDPGIDHMSAMKVLDAIRDQGGQITAFESFTGGLLAPNTADNPWNYKFTWNPRNVVLAGQGVVKFIQEGRYKYIPYNKLFRRTEMIHIPEYGYFEGYANRDSLKYLNLYGLEDIGTMFRGTLRRPGFCKAWDVFVQLGATDDTYEMEGVASMTHRQFINSFLTYNPNDSIELKLAHYLQLDLEGEEMHRLTWLDIFSEDLVGLDNGTPAQILQHILKKKWTMEEDEGDMIVMWHKFNYLLDGKEKEEHATFVMIGENQASTAMAKTVGLPMGIATKRILNGEISARGVLAPTIPGIYEPILDELTTEHDCTFIENKVK
jgi:saccharopine dehydrogenase (NADP+, L-glutamate forming)